MIDRLGRYEIRGILGEGGFATVYRGWDPHLEREVAIKTIRATSQEVRDRFVREAKISARLFHPHIVTTFDVGTEGESPFLVQELLEGDDLDKVVSRSSKPPADTLLGWLVDLARALHYAHGLGIVHRDVKPANVRILPDETLKVLDFGIAHASQNHERITKAGFAVGTLTYASPEQLQGKTIDLRLDVYSFGVTAYEILSSRQPFVGQSVAELVRKIATQEPEPIGEHWHECPGDLAVVIHRCMAKHPDERFSSFETIIAELQWIRYRMALESKVEAPIHSTRRGVEAGDWIFREGDRGSEMFIVDRGTVEILQSGKLLIELQQGDFFGEMSLIETGARSASARALSSCQLEVIDSSTFDTLIRLNPEITVRIMRKLAARIRDKDREVSPPADSPSIAEAAATLRHEDSPWKYSLTGKSEMTVGRIDRVTGIQPDIDLTEIDPDLAVSRRHARIEFRSGAYYLIEEVGVVNGTWINGQRLQRGEEMCLADGDLLVFSSVPLALRLE